MQAAGWDLNCDLGEGETPSRTAELMGLVDSVNIACGGHAGDDITMRRCLELAAGHGVRAGAHPGFPDRAEFGRTMPGGAPLEGTALMELLARQIGDIARIAGAIGVPLRHVKLHGALYHAVEADPGLARTYLRAVADGWPGLVVYARAGGSVERAAWTGGPVVWPEGYLDRAYRQDGTLVPRSEPGAVLEDAAIVVQRLRDLRSDGRCRTVDGGWVRIAACTWCIHGDSPGSTNLLRAVRAEMTADR